ncbi:MAG: hypothetical protein Q7S96_03555 [bacterium]|nr:hypothetical protein [bacterium]
MRREHWADLLDRIAERFSVTDRGTTTLEDVPSSEVLYVEFTGPMGHMRVEFITKPRTLGERALGSRRIGGETTVQKRYDENDLVSFLRAFRWDDAEAAWEEINADAIPT